MGHQVRGLITALNGNKRYKFKNPEHAVDHLVVGGGVVGLAVAQKLTQRYPSNTTYLVERHAAAGEEISSRNSEVVHAGLYYPPNSLKTQLCLRGRTLLYERCRAHNIPHKKTGKLVVAQENQRPYIENLHAKAQKFYWPSSNGPKLAQQGPMLPTKLISGDEAREMEPDLHPNIAAALWSPETGIVDSHAFMESLEAQITDSEGGELVYGTKVVRIDRSRDEHGWVVQTITGDSEDGGAILAKTVINCAGLSAPLILNSILPDAARIPMYFARGSYASYRGPGAKRVSHLIYPCPAVGNDSHAFHSLGTHLTLDLQGKARFGPDLDWLSPPEDDNADFWQRHLVPDDSRMDLIYQAVKEYLPGVEPGGFQPDYSGVRPKLVGPGAGFQDFVFRVDTVGGGEAGGRMISLLGIESPGLTSSLAIAEHVVDVVLGGNIV